MEWRNPSVLFSLIPLTLVWVGISIYGFQRNISLRSKFLEIPMTAKLMPTASLPRFLARLLLQLVGVVSLVVALAGPQFGEIVEMTAPKGSDLYVLLDVSRSMLANDVPPTRLDRAKSDITALSNRLNGERIGLIVFAGQAVVKCPLTIDYESFRRTLADVDTNSAPRGGTAIGDAIRKAMEVFVTTSQRHQAILLISDGDDQESYPLDAAEFASERGVTIFAVGLGDALTGARIPEKPNSGSFVEFGGEQVWSKLDNTLLEQIATKTSGVYVPAGTQAYDLGKIYSDYLAGREGEATDMQKRVKRADQFQWFLAVGLFAMLCELCMHSYRKLPQIGSIVTVSTSMNRAAGILFLFACMLVPSVVAEDATQRIQQGIKLYSESKFQDASEAFATASEILQKDNDTQSSLATFDQACAEHRLGNREKAIDLYLKAAMSKDRSLASKSQFNLGKLQVEALMEKSNASSDSSKSEQPAKPEEIIKLREEIVDLAKQAITAYRNSLELDGENLPARRNLEIVRQWLKLTTDRWREEDRQKRRDETNLLQFLDYLIETEQSIFRESSQLKDLYALDRHAELKQVQDELIDEIPTLRSKITDTLTKKEAPNNPSSNDPKTAASEKEVEKAIEMLENWVDTAREHMRQSSRTLGQFRASESFVSQQNAVDELEKIWDAVAPFQAVLGKALAEQTKIVNDLKPTENGRESLDVEDEIPEKILKDQQRTLARTRLLAPKAEAELSMLKQAPTPEAIAPQTELEQKAEYDAAPEQLTEEQKREKAKEGLQKAIELAPAAVEAMINAIANIQKKNKSDSVISAEEARRILEEIAKSQPPPPPQENQQQNNDQQQNDTNQDQQQNQNKDDSQSNKDKSQADPKQPEDSEKKENDQEKESKPDENQKDSSDQKNKDAKDQTKQNGKAEDKKMSQDRIEEALRKVREREAEKRERDRQMKTRAYGRPSVEKDW
ncbi:MAG: VWA domain-containing protein [Pirellula sp.]|jgi:Ca-activated chloride channel family protein|nr:VWA domain-containing protein [Pirellula sp.]